jgi:hypothetical protein
MLTGLLGGLAAFLALVTEDCTRTPAAGHESISVVGQQNHRCFRGGEGGREGGGRWPCGQVWWNGGGGRGPNAQPSSHAMANGPMLESGLSHQLRITTKGTEYSVGSSTLRTPYRIEIITTSTSNWRWPGLDVGHLDCRFLIVDASSLSKRPTEYMMENNTYTIRRDSHPSSADLIFVLTTIGSTYPSVFVLDTGAATYAVLHTCSRVRREMKGGPHTAHTKQPCPDGPTNCPFRSSCHVAQLHIQLL